MPFSRLCALACALTVSAASEEFEVPVLDISSFINGSSEVRRGIADAITNAFADFGFVVVKGHGVPEKAFDDAYYAAKEFFQKPRTEKARYDLGHGYGYGGYLSNMETGGQLAGEASGGRPDSVESLTLRGLQHLAAEAADGSCRRGGGAAPAPARHFAQDMSDVPAADGVPCSPAGLLPSVVALHAALRDFKEAMTEITELAMGAAPNSLRSSFDPRKGGVRFAYYPERQAEGHNTDYGAHADSASMVILRLDRENPAGTEVFHRGAWLPVPHVPGGLVVNLGTVLSRLTGGRWKAAVHRATRAGRRERLSLVLGALVPPNDLPITCLRSICGEPAGPPVEPPTAGPAAGGPPLGGARSPPPTVKEYLDARVRLQRPEVSPQDRRLVDFVDQLA